MDIIEPDGVATVAGLEVRCRFTRHPVPTIGLLLTEGHKTLGWSGDTAFEEAHVDWLSGADLIVHDTNLSDVHTPIERLNALPAELQRKIRLIHMADDFDASTTQMKPLSEGDVLEL